MCDEASVTLNNTYIHTSIYGFGWIQVTPDVILNNITPLNIF